MDLPAHLSVIIWLNIRLCLPFTFLFIILCCLVRLDHVPVSYYVNLLLSNLIQLILLINLLQVPYSSWRDLPSAHIFVFCAMASLSFRMIIPLERTFSISILLSSCIAQTKGFVISVLVWVFFFLPLFIVLNHELPYLFFFLLPAPVLIVCLALTLRSIPSDIPVSAEEKQRTVRILIVLFIHYSVSIFPMVIWGIFSVFISRAVVYSDTFFPVFFSLFLLGYFNDLLLFVVMCNGIVENLLRFLCHCRTENTERTECSRSPV